MPPQVGIELQLSVGSRAMMMPSQRSPTQPGGSSPAWAQHKLKAVRIVSDESSVLENEPEAGWLASAVAVAVACPWQVTRVKFQLNE